MVVAKPLAETNRAKSTYAHIDEDFPLDLGADSDGILFAP